MSVESDAAPGLLRADTREWSLTLRQGLALVAIAPILAVVGLATAPFRGLFDFLASEDGPVEYGQWAFIVGIVVLYVLLARLLWRRDLRLLAGLYLIAALGFAFIGGEEISWGQRILGFATPDALGEINKQDEANVHNIGSVLLVFNLTVVAICAVAIALPILRWTIWRDRARSIAAYVLVPALVLVPLFAFPLGYRLMRYVFLPESGHTVTRYAEFAELSFYIGLFTFALLARRVLVAAGDRSAAATTKAPQASGFEPASRPEVARNHSARPS
jgi:cytochrome b561